MLRHTQQHTIAGAPCNGAAGMPSLHLEYKAPNPLQQPSSTSTAAAHQLQPSANLASPATAAAGGAAGTPPGPLSGTVSVPVLEAAAAVSGAACVHTVPAAAVPVAAAPNSQAGDTPAAGGDRPEVAHLPAAGGCTQAAAAAPPAQAAPRAQAAAPSPAALPSPAPAHASAPAVASQARDAAAAALARAVDSSSSWCRQRLDGSLLLQQLVLLSASLAAAVKRGEARSILEVLTLIEAVPATAQLLFSSQVAVPVRRLVKRLQKQQQKQQRQAAGSVVPDEVLAKAQAMLQRWQVVLAAEVAALDSKQATRARQLVKARLLKQAKPLAAAPASTTTAAAAAGGGGSGRGAAGRQRAGAAHAGSKRSRQRQEQQGGDKPAPPAAAARGLPPKKPRQQRGSSARPPRQQNNRPGSSSKQPCGPPAPHPYLPPPKPLQLLPPGAAAAAPTGPVMPAPAATQYWQQQLQQLAAGCSPGTGGSTSSLATGLPGSGSGLRGMPAFGGGNAGGQLSTGIGAPRLTCQALPSGTTASQLAGSSQRALLLPPAPLDAGAAAAPWFAADGGNAAYASLAGDAWMTTAALLQPLGAGAAAAGGGGLGAAAAALEEAEDDALLVDAPLLPLQQGHALGGMGGFVL